MILTALSDGASLIVLNKGVRLIETLTQIITEHSFKGGFLIGIGALKNVELGYYDLEQQIYLHKKFEDENFELISVNGNISLKNNTPYIHAHALLGRRDFTTFGGHLFEAEVAVTAEIMLLPLGKMPKRTFKKDIGLELICGF